MKAGVYRCKLEEIITDKIKAQLGERCCNNKASTFNINGRHGTALSLIDTFSNDKSNRERGALSNRIKRD